MRFEFNICIALLAFFTPAAVFAADPFIREDYPIVKLEFETSQATTPLEMLTAVDKAITDAAANLQDPWVRSELVDVTNFILAGNLTKTETPMSSVVSGYTDSTYHESGSQAIGLTAVLGSRTKVTGFQVFLNDFLPNVPLAMRLVTLHETLGHLAQYLTIFKIYGAEGAMTQLRDANFGSNFNKLTHATAALLELQFMRAVPLESFIDEINATAYPGDYKLVVADFYKRIYQLSPQEFIKEKATQEACGPNPGCISETEFQDFFTYFRSVGFTWI